MARFAFVLVGRVALAADAIILLGQCPQAKRRDDATAASADDHKCLLRRRPHRHLPLPSFVSSSSSEAEAVILARAVMTSPALPLLPPLIRLFVRVAR